MLFMVLTARWFEERKADSRNLLTVIFRAMQNGQRVVLRNDYRTMNVEEAKEISRPLSDLAGESNYVFNSLQEIPYQLEVEDMCVLPFAKNGLEAVFDEIGGVLKSHLTDGLKQLIQLPGHSVVASARGAIICGLWQTLVNLSPFLDVLHPLALRWNELRARFCCWVWGAVRNRLDVFWNELCKSNLGREDNLPKLRWSIRCLPNEREDDNLACMPDLTEERLLLLLQGPRMLDRICSAFYRFLCTGMANAKAALGSSSMDITGPLISDNLDHFFASSEPSLKDIFCDVWSKNRIRPGTPIEDALHNPDIAAAGFLKRYAYYVLSGLEQRDLTLDNPPSSPPPISLQPEAPTLKQQRKRRGLTPSESFNKNELPPSLLLGSLSLQTLRKQIKSRPNKKSTRGLLLDDNLNPETDDKKSSPPDLWLQSLPISLKRRLTVTLPSNDLQDKLKRRDALNSVFPKLPDWLANSPTWKLWPPPIKLPEGLCSPWSKMRSNSVADYGGPTLVHSHPLLPTNQQTPKPPLGETDWDLIRSVLECLS